jgi:hypothetical protein
MNYRDFFKNKKATAKDIQNLIPEGVDAKEFQKGILAEIKQTEDEFVAAKIASKNLQSDAHYYSKIQEHCGYCGEDEEEEEGSGEYDDNGGLPLLGGALNVPHHGQPIRLGKVIQIGRGFGGPATGELSGMTAAGSSTEKAGVAKDKGGLLVSQDGDKETITAGGKKTDGSVASKSVGGAVAPGEGQKQGGLNTKGTIANTPKLDENKAQVRKIVKEVLKEIRFDKESGKWVKLNEGGHKAGCKCAFCKNKGSFGKKDKKEEMDEATVDMKMGPSYKVVQPILAKTSEPDMFARTNQYEPEISEMYDDEEECMMNERYVALANAQRNLTETELSELKSLREKIDRISEKKKFLKKAVNPAHKGYCTPMSKPTCTPHRKAFARMAKAGKFSKNDESIEEVAPPGWEGTVKAMKKHSVGGAKRWNPKKEEEEETVGVEEAEKKKITNPYALAWWMKNKGYKSHKEEDEALDPQKYPGAEEMDEATVDMKMGPSYKVVQPTLAKTSEPDMFARTNQYDPEVSEGEEQEDEAAMDEAGGQAVQHSSYRTITHGNLPQSGKQRWADDLDEASKKPSKVAKTIQKGMKPKTTLKNPKLKFQKPKKTTSGVHKRKP